jgi:hypothetical protein
MNSRSKGKRGELEASKEWVKVMGGACRRGQQFAGGNDSPDLVHDFAGIHIEVKRTERGNPYSWLEQAIADCQGKVPVILHRRSNQPWIVVMRLDDVPRFVLEAQAGPQASAVGVRAVPGDHPGTGLSDPA